MKRDLTQVFGCLTLTIACFSSQAQDVIQLLPDPCSLTTHNREIQVDSLDIRGSFPAPLRPVVVYGESSVLRGLPGTIDVAVIVNGNSYYAHNYTNIANFLAKNGFLVAVVTRPGASAAYTNTDYIFDSLDSVFDYYGLSDQSKVALIGHSKGGGVVNNVAVENKAAQHGYKIRSLVNVSPNVDISGALDGSHTSSFLALYGSRDRDMAGTAGIPREGFAAYDQVGTEGSTTCSTPPCWAFTPLLNKTMKYVNGADHAEFLGTPTKTLGNPPETAYLSDDDQFCIGKAYINAFLRLQMRGESIYKGFLRDQWRPLSMLMMDSSDNDGLGEPAGSDIRVYTQFSPKQKQSIENFEDGQYSTAFKSPNVVLQINNEGDLSGGAQRVRHLTNSLAIGWTTHPNYQYMAFNIPANRRNATHFSHLSLRIGQLRGAPAPYQNTNQDEAMWVGLRDGNSFRWERLDIHGDIPRADSHTAMSTIAIPLTEFNGLDKSDIREIYFAFFPNTRGTVLLDNIDWLRDN